jgi:transcriptional regulator with XRE-family HTH domain
MNNKRILRTLEDRPTPDVRMLPAKYFARAMLDIRLRLGLTRPDVEEKSGIHFNSIENWEIGDFQPRLLDAEVWANSLDFDLYLILVPKK